MSSVETEIERIQRPGNGWGSGCTVVARREGVTEGVAWTRVTVEDNYTSERSRHYFTEGGFVVEAAHGTYGDPTRWCVHGYNAEGRAKMGPGDAWLGSIRYFVNLAACFDYIADRERVHAINTATDQESQP